MLPARRPSSCRSATRCVAYRLAPSCQVIASASPARVWSITRCSIVAMSMHVLQIMIMPAARAPRRHLDTCVRSLITHEPCYLAVTVKYRFICPRLLVVGHVAALEPSRAGR
jgi:hypothetical protein